jgi:pyruvate/2-oxoglutarate dehydrogenase complex dihydrolipoamide acyltransferase (E2) component
MPNIVYTGRAADSAWRRVAAGFWAAPSDPTIYGLLDYDARALLERIEALRAAGHRVTVTHVVARAIALVLARHPDCNVVLRRGRVWQRATVDVFLQVAVPAEGGELGKAELSGVKIERADQLDLPALATTFESSVAQLRAHKDLALDRSRRQMARIPRMLLRPILRLSQWLTVALNLDLSRFGVARDPFGSVAVTSIGMWDLETAFAPLLPVSGPPLLLLVGAIKQRPVVDEHGQVVARPILRIGGTFDHRVLDGYQLSVLARDLKQLLERDVDQL